MEYLFNTSYYGFNENIKAPVRSITGKHIQKAATEKGKRSFLVFNHNKYTTIPIDTIALFYIKYESTMIMCFDKREYSVNHSLEQIQNLVSGQQFFRLNRQFLVNFNAVKEVEHYFARKLLVEPVISFTCKLIVSKEKARSFLDWLADR